MVTRKAWVPGVGIYTVYNSEDASDPTRGTVSLGTAKSKVEADAEKSARVEQLDRLRSSAAIKFETQDEKTPTYQRQADSDESADDEKEENVDMTTGLEAFLRSTALCNLASVKRNEETGKWQTRGDPTEIALQVFAYRFDHGKESLEQQGWEQLAEYPFDSSVKRMSVAYSSPKDGTVAIFTKGAFERIIDLCVEVGIGDHKQRMTDSVKKCIEEQASVFADQGLRVLAVARRGWHGDISEKSGVFREEVEKDLTLLGLAGLYDPPRLETKDAVKSEPCSRFILFNMY